MYKFENLLHCIRLLECNMLLLCPHFSKFSVNHRNQYSELSINRSLALKLVSLMDVINCRRNIARLDSYAESEEKIVTDGLNM
jgi:hypothetical protein